MTQRNQKGFTLLEMLLVLAISSSLIVLMLNYTTQKADQLRRDKTAMQMEQILNGALSYYVNNSQWPITAGQSCQTVGANTDVNPTPGPSTSSLVTDGYLPQTIIGPYINNLYTYNCVNYSSANAPNAAFYVYTQVDTFANASIIAAQLPMAYVTDNTIKTVTPASPPTQTASCAGNAPPATCNYVVSFINIPGQNLNNARSINYMGVYTPSSCVPAPNCPPGMKPSITVVPAGVSGVFESPTCANSKTPWNPSSSGCQANVYPISSFTAFAVGYDSGGDPGDPGIPGAAWSTDAQTVYDCAIGANALQNRQPCLVTQGGDSFTKTSGDTKASSNLTTTVNYWRVCLAVVTEKGQIIINSGSVMAEWGKMTGNVAVFTRCVPNSGNESPVGTTFNVWQSNINYNP